MPADTPAFSLPVSADALRPLIRATVVETLAAVETDRERIPADRLAYTEHEAAAMLGLNYHQLRDLRKRGGIAHTRVVGNQIRYLRDDILAYLAEKRVEAA
jgi:excisionase family DNA binding protein